MKEEEITARRCPVWVGFGLAKGWGFSDGGGRSWLGGWVLVGTAWRLIHGVERKLIRMHFSLPGGRGRIMPEWERCWELDQQTRLHECRKIKVPLLIPSPVFCLTELELFEYRFRQRIFCNRSTLKAHRYTEAGGGGGLLGSVCFLFCNKQAVYFTVYGISSPCFHSVRLLLCLLILFLPVQFKFVPFAHECHIEIIQIVGNIIFSIHIFKIK